MDAEILECYFAPFLSESPELLAHSHLPHKRVPECYIDTRLVFESKCAFLLVGNFIAIGCCVGCCEANIALHFSTNLKESIFGIFKKPVFKRVYKTDIR